jgi:hypothetical protein
MKTWPFNEIKIQFVLVDFDYIGMGIRYDDYHGYSKYDDKSKNRKKLKSNFAIRNTDIGDY